MKILHVISSLEQNGAARQLGLLSEHQAPGIEHVAVCILGAASPSAGVLRPNGWSVQTLGWTRPLGLSGWWRFRRLVRSFAPDVIHAWDRRALRAFALLARPSPAPLVVSHIPADAWQRGGWLQRRLFDRVTRIVVRGPVERERWLAAGIPEGKLHLTPPGVRVDTVAVDATADAAVDAAVSLATLATDARAVRWIACAGELAPRKGFYDAIWAFDILSYLCHDIHLAVIGDGPERGRLEHLARAIGATGRVHFLGARADAAAILAQADIVWVCDHHDGGVNVALEAMAAARPVVASRVRVLADIIVEGQTGFLVPSGDKIVLNRRTRLLLDDARLRRRMGQAGCQHAARLFSAQAFCANVYGLYATLAA